MFPRYIFARFDADRQLHQIWHTRGVDAVVRQGENPAVIDDEIIGLLQARSDENGFVKLGDEFQSGDKIVITDGPLRNFAGVFERDMKQSERVMVLLNAVSYQGHVMVGRNDLRKVA
jgi:transcription antitermination factor NusG